MLILPKKFIVKVLGRNSQCSLIAFSPTQLFFFSYDFAKTLFQNDMPTMLAMFKPGFKIYKRYQVINQIY